MDFIYRLPVIISLFTTILVGILVKNKVNDIRNLSAILSVTLVSFYILGRLLRRVLLESMENLNELEEAEGPEEHTDASEENQIDNQSAEASNIGMKETPNESSKGRHVDYAVDAGEDEMIPLDSYADRIKTKE